MDTDDESESRVVIPAEDITVAIFCALPYESAAVTFSLSEEFDCRPKHIGPLKYVYHFGRIGEHKIVIAQPHSMGTVNAARCAATVCQQFPNVRFALLLGIGAGIPSLTDGGLKRDIRLGDIAVSIPQDGHPGVLQYDYGKREADGKFVLKGCLDKSHPLLLSADATMQVGEVMKKNMLRKALKRITEKSGFARPDTADILFDKEFNHAASGNDCTECLNRAPQKVVERVTKPAEPQVHRGLILSGSSVVKNSEDRSHLRRDNPDAICYEMEAAGIMDEIPCLVVRGICDYADTHKQDGWHYYAAAVAAAYGRALLLNIYGEHVRAEKTMKDILNQILSVSTDTKAGVKSLQSSAHREKIREWLSPPDPSTNLNKARELYQRGTGQWLLHSDLYRTWKKKPASFMWLYGIAGCGKTILSSTVIADLQGNETTAQSLLYFYFDFTDVEKRSTEKAVRSLIDQLYRKSTQAQGVLDSLYATNSQGRDQPSYASLQMALQSMITKCQNTWIILDGLDECETRGQHATNSVMLWVKKLRSSSRNAHILITSRPEEDIKSSVEAWAVADEIVALQSGLIAGDMRAYIQAKVEEMERWRTEPDIQKLIATKLNERAKGMFRLVACQFDTLEHCLSRKDIDRELATLPRTLDETYRRIFDRIYPEYKPSAIRLLQLLTYSKRPLRIEEAVDAIAVEPASKPRFDPRNRIKFPSEITRYCSGLVSLNTNYDTKSEAHVTEIQLAHFSVQEYLQSDRLQPALAPHLDATSAAVALVDLCLSYLLELNTSLSLSETKRQYPFAEFSARYWSKYAAVVESSTQGVLDTVEEYYKSRDAFNLGYLISDIDRHLTGEYRWHEARHSPLYYASIAGLSNSVYMLIKERSNMGIECGDLGLFLQIAAWHGHESIVKFLIQNGADINAPSELCDNSLQAASGQGHESIVKFLIQNGADINASGGLHGNALQAASGQGHENIVKFLIKNGADVNASDPDGICGSALQAASHQGHESIVKFLLQNGADINAPGGRHSSALQDACAQGHKAIVHMLLDSGANIEARGGAYESALAAACDSGADASIVQILIQNGVDVNMPCEFRGTPLQAASFAGRKSLVEVLIQSGADLNVRSGDIDSTPWVDLDGSAFERYLRAVRRGDTDLKARNGKYGSPLWVASVKGHLEIVQLLIQHGADVNLQEEGELSSAVQAASSKGHMQVVQLLVQNGADLDVSSVRSVDLFLKLMMERSADVHEAGGECAL